MTGSADAQVLYAAGDDGVAVATLNRPVQRNAVNGEIATLLEAIVERAEADDAVRVVILASGHATVFCAGADLGEIAAGRADRLVTATGGFAGFVRKARRKPWIAAVDGAAFAGGCEIALACDMIVASVAGRFALPEVKRGLYAGAGGPLRIQQALPRAVAIELLCTGDPIGGERAYALGMVNRLAEPGRALADARALARAIAANAPLAVRETLAVARDLADLDEAGFWDRSTRTTEAVLSSADALEGARAFLEKREPLWSGR